MENEYLYSLQDVLEQIELLDELLEKHRVMGEETSHLMIEQYRAKREGLLVSLEQIKSQIKRNEIEKDVD